MSEASRTDARSVELKERILEAALKLSHADNKPSRLDGQRMVAAGACTEEEFVALFPTRSAFRRELLGLLFAEARAAVIRVTTAIPSGLEQLLTAFRAYLDYNLAHPALQELAHQVQFDPVGYDMLMRMETGTAMVTQADLQAAGATHAAARARLLTSAAVAVVRAEFKAGKVQPELREVLAEYCALSCEGIPESPLGD